MCNASSQMALVTDSYCFFFFLLIFLFDLIGWQWFFLKKKALWFFLFLFIGLPQFHDFERRFGKLTRVKSHLFFFCLSIIVFMWLLFLFYLLIFDLLKIDFCGFFIFGASDHGLASNFFFFTFFLSHNLTFIFFF
jgi:hypothetical protein